MKAGWTISAIGHVAVLTWGLVTFVGRPAHAPPPPDFFADVISDAELSQITQGIRTAKLAVDLVESLFGKSTLMRD